jgi:hypothetical protein
MHALVLVAVLQGVVSIAPIRVFQPYPYVKCPKGYSLWWPAGKEFNNDAYAECVQAVVKQASVKPAKKITTDVSLKQKVK